MAKETITIEINVDSPAQRKSIERDVQTFAKLPHDDRSRISQIMNNSKALKSLADKWTMLKMMF